MLYLRKQEAIEANDNLHQGEIRLRDIYCQEKMKSYTDTLGVMDAIIMEMFPTNDQIKNRKQLILK